jgi:hypothetical protein
MAREPIPEAGTVKQHSTFSGSRDLVRRERQVTNKIADERQAVKRDDLATEGLSKRGGSSGATAWRGHGKEDLAAEPGTAGRTNTPHWRLHEVGLAGVCLAVEPRFSSRGEVFAYRGQGVH